MREYLLNKGFNEVAPGLFLRSPLRVEITPEGTVCWTGTKRAEINWEELRKTIEQTEFRTKLKNGKHKHV